MFGLADNGFKPSRVALFLVPNTTTNTLVPLFLMYFLMEYFALKFFDGKNFTLKFFAGENFTLNYFSGENVALGPKKQSFVISMD